MSEPLRTVVTDRPGPEQPVVVEKLAPVWAILIRVARTYVQGLVGFLLALGVAPDLLPVDQALRLLPFLAKLELAAELAIAPTAIALLMNALEILTALDVKQPRLRA